MRLTSACLALALTGLAAAALPAHAGDLGNGAAGGIKDYGSGPVPAPMPVSYNETFKWYVRGDLGTGFKSTGTIGVDGLPLNVSQPGGWRELSILSFGFGRYITPVLRAELTLDYRPERNISAGVQNTAITQSQVTQTALLNGSINTTTATNTYTGVVNDTTAYQNTTLLMSGFYDFNEGGRLRPYVGVGGGLAVHQLRNNDNGTLACFTGTATTTNSSTGVSTTTTGCNGASPLTATSQGTGLGYGIAAQLSAGVTYDVSPRIHWDTGYRMLWQSGHLAVTTAGGLGTFTLGNHTDHEVRTGFRWDLY